MCIKHWNLQCFLSMSLNVFNTTIGKWYIPSLSGGPLGGGAYHIYVCSHDSLSYTLAFKHPSCCHFRWIFGMRLEACSFTHSRTYRQHRSSRWPQHHSQPTCLPQLEAPPNSWRSTHDSSSTVPKPVSSPSSTSTLRTIQLTRHMTRGHASPRSSWRSAMNKNDRSYSTSYSNTSKNPTTIGPADGTSAHTVKYGTHATTLCRWFPQQILMTVALRPLQHLPLMPHGIEGRPTPSPRCLATHRDASRRTQRTHALYATRTPRPHTNS